MIKLLIIFVLIGFSLVLLTETYAQLPSNIEAKTVNENLFSGGVKTVPYNSYVNDQYQISFVPPLFWIQDEPLEGGFVRYESATGITAALELSYTPVPPSSLSAIQNLSAEDFALEMFYDIEESGITADTFLVTKFNDGFTTVISVEMEEGPLSGLTLASLIITFLTGEQYSINYLGNFDGASRFLESMETFHVGPVNIESDPNPVTPPRDPGCDLPNFPYRHSDGICYNNPEGSSGCLIATATYGSELAPQVQQLREIRDNSLLQTNSGAAFMTGFNAIYYSFAPTVSDLERQNPVFKEAVKLTITPLISSLSLLQYVEMDTEASVLGYGISIILLNIGMYFGIPAIVIVGIRKRF